MSENNVFEMREALDLETIYWDEEEELLNERHREQWAAMTPEEKRIYETVMFAIHPEEDEGPLWKKLPANYFRDRTVAELEREIREKYGVDEKLSERLRTVMQDYLDDDRLMGQLYFFESDDEDED